MRLLKAIIALIILCFACSISFGQTWNNNALGNTTTNNYQKGGVGSDLIMVIPLDSNETIGSNVRKNGRIAIINGLFTWYDSAGGKWQVAANADIPVYDTPNLEQVTRQDQTARGQSHTLTPLLIGEDPNINGIGRVTVTIDSTDPVALNKHGIVIRNKVGYTYETNASTGGLFVNQIVKSTNSANRQEHILGHPIDFGIWAQVTAEPGATDTIPFTSVVFLTAAGTSTLVRKELDLLTLDFGSGSPINQANAISIYEPNRATFGNTAIYMTNSGPRHVDGLYGIFEQLGGSYRNYFEGDVIIGTDTTDNGTFPLQITGNTRTTGGVYGVINTTMDIRGEGGTMTTPNSLVRVGNGMTLNATGQTNGINIAPTALTMGTGSTTGNLIRISTPITINAALASSANGLSMSNLWANNGTGDISGINIQPTGVSGTGRHIAYKSSITSPTSNTYDMFAATDGGQGVFIRSKLHIQNTATPTDDGLGREFRVTGQGIVSDTFLAGIFRGLNLSSGMLKSDASGNISNATAGTDYQAPLTFSTGLTNTANTITNNVSTGVSGGQTINGGTAANDDLTIQGTTNGTKTTSYVNLQTTGGLVGIGLTAPATVFNIRTSAASGGIGYVLNEMFNNADAPYWKSTRARGTSGSPTATQSSDDLGGFLMQGYNGSSYVYGGGIFLGQTGAASTTIPSRWRFLTGDGTTTAERLGVSSTEMTATVPVIGTQLKSSAIATGASTDEVALIELADGEVKRSGVSLSAITLPFTQTNAGTLSPALNTRYYFNGTTSTWTLPAVAANANNVIIVRNAGTGTITVNSSVGGNDIVVTTEAAATNTASVASGEEKTFKNYNNTYWVIY